MSRGFPGYIGYQSDSEVFTHILHYTKTGLGVEAYKHIITPLQDADSEKHPTPAFEAAQAVLPPPDHRRAQLRHRVSAGPQPVHGAGPQETASRRRGRPARGYAFSSEICGLDAAIPDRDKSKDFQPMHLDTAIVGPDRQEVSICSQTDPLPLLH
jgi:hypothetical protein